jgi:hypothetical protein
MQGIYNNTHDYADEIKCIDYTPLKDGKFLIHQQVEFTTAEKINALCKATFFTLLAVLTLGLWNATRALCCRAITKLKVGTTLYEARVDALFLQTHTVLRGELKQTERVVEKIMNSNAVWHILAEGLQQADKQIPKQHSLILSQKPLPRLPNVMWQSIFAFSESDEYRALSGVNRQLYRCVK